MIRWTKYIILTLLFSSGIGVKVSAQINTDYVMMMGRNALYYEDYVLSIQRFNQVINAKPHLAEPYFYRALAKFYLEDYAGADTDCSIAVDRNPYQENTYVLRGLCRVNMGKYAPAEEDYRKITKMNPLNSSCWHNLVLCQMELKEYEQADSALDIMIRQWPREADNYSLKAQVCFARSDTANALDWIDRALEVDSYSGQAWSMRAMVTLSRGQYQQGEEELSKAILQMPRNANLFLNRALARYQLRNLRGAMADYDVALELQPGSYLGHFNRGLLRAQVGDDNRAIEDFNFVLEQEPDNMIALYNRALLLDNTGDYRGAIRDISSVIKAYPQFWAGYQTRASIRRKIGDVYGAERDEFLVLKAEMEKRTGTYKSRSRTRKKSEKDPSEYDKLVEEDTQEPEKEEYASEYRGKVQNKATDLVPEPMYVLTYDRRESAIRNFVAFHSLVAQVNEAHSLPSMLYLSNVEAIATEGRMNEHFRDIELVSEAIDAAAPSAISYLRRALDYYQVRDFTASLDDLTRALVLEENNALAYFLRAQVRCAQQSANNISASIPLSAEDKIGYGQALKDLERVMQLSPDMVYAQYNIGNVYVSLKDFPNAIAAYSRALEIDPKFADAYYNRGVVRLMDGQTDAGLSDLSQAGEYGLYSAYSLIKRYSGVKK